MVRHSFISAISIIIPVFNEQDSIAPLIKEIIATLINIEYELIYVDDGSSDATYSELKKQQNQHPQISIIRHLSNSGKSNSLLSGIRAAKYDWIVTLDGDQQNDPRDIFNLIAAIEKTGNIQNTVVFGNRERRQDNWIKYFSSKISNRVRKNALNDDCSDAACGLKLFPKHAFLQLPEVNNFHRFLPALFKWKGYKLLNISVNHRPRVYGVSKYGINNRLWVGIADLLRVWRLQRRSRIMEDSQYDES